MEKIKTFKAIYECKHCGTIHNTERKIIVDEYSNKKLTIPKPKEKCECNSTTFKLINLELIS